MSRSRGVGAAFDCRLGYPDASLALKLPRTRADWFGVREADAICGTTTAGGANNGGTVFEIAKTATGYASTPTFSLGVCGAVVARTLLLAGEYSRPFGANKGATQTPVPVAAAAAQRSAAG